jgi:hypothetical protein
VHHQQQETWYVQLTRELKGVGDMGKGWRLTVVSEIWVGDMAERRGRWRCGEFWQIVNVKVEADADGSK